MDRVLHDPDETLLIEDDCGERVRAALKGFEMTEL